MEKKLIQLFTKFQFTDLLAFGRILGVEEKDDFVEYVTEIVEQFQLQDKKKQKDLLKLAKDVAAANKILGVDNSGNKKM